MRTLSARISKLGAIVAAAALVGAGYALPGGDLIPLSRLRGALLMSLESEDIPIGNFTDRSFGQWTSKGSAFGPRPLHGSELKDLGIEADKYTVTSLAGGKDSTGVLMSPDFKISRNYISFEIAGGDYERDTCMDLVVDGKVVKSATGGSRTRLTSISWNVEGLKGKEAHLEIIDRAGGDWGHIEVADVLQTDRPVVLPIDKGVLYHETLRPQFHFTARQWTMDRLEPVERQEGWINDLNGLIYYEGEYHLFAQRWAKCWLHAVSKDLIHWTELSPAFWEENLDSGVQSGTCVIDYKNTSGLSSDPDNPAMVAFWSRFDNHSQCICYSLDRGRTWKRYEKDPYMDRPERDPKVFWHAPSKHWVMFLYGDGQYHILTSKNLLDWTDEKRPIADSFECPDFFQLPVDGDGKNKKWVLIQGNGNYSIGEFDGVEFKEESQRYPCDIGPNFYATQSWANTETGDGRRIQTAWMRAPKFPRMPFNQQVSFPCELSLRNTSKGLRIYRQPIRELSHLHTGQAIWTNHKVNDGEIFTLSPSGDLFQIEAEVSIPEGVKLSFDLRGNRVEFTGDTLASGTEPKKTEHEIKHIEILLDRGSIETFLNQGEVSSTRFALPEKEGISILSEGGIVTIHRLSLYRLKSAWQ